MSVVSGTQADYNAGIISEFRANEGRVGGRWVWSTVTRNSPTPRRRAAGQSLCSCLALFDDLSVQFQDGWVRRVAEFRSEESRRVLGADTHIGERTPHRRRNDHDGPIACLKLQRPI